MKRKKKFQNQQIILNQDTHIKFYSNFLTFCSLNSFRLKYYYIYLKFASMFRFYNSFLVNSFLINFFLVKLISSSLLYLNFFNFYESNLLQKFVDSKNIFNDYINYIKVKSNLNIIKYSGCLNKSFLEKYSFFISNIRDDGQNFNSLCYFQDLNIFVDADLLAKYSYGYHIQLLQNFMFYVSYINHINLYKFFILLNLYKIYK